ncbi:MAG: Gfo/Idh/MocA family protein [Anaerolineae bacterium]
MAVLHPLTVAVLGTGRQARAHAQTLLAIGRQQPLPDGAPGVDVLLYGRDETKLSTLAAELGVRRATTDIERAVTADDVDVVDNCLINALHYEPLRLAVGHGKHCITEKPLTGNLAQSRQLVAAADAAAIRHTIVQNMRYYPGPAEAKRIIEGGALGRVFHVRAVFGYLVPETIANRPSWFYRKEEARGGIVADIMSHMFDLFGWMVGPVQSVFCQAATYLPNRREADGRPFHSDVEDAAALVLRFAGGAMADIMLSWVRRKHEAMPTFEIDGERGSLVFGYDQLHRQRGEGTLHRFSPAGSAPTDQWAGWEETALAAANPFAQQLGGFIDALRSGAPFEPNWHTGLRCEQLIDVAYRSAEHGRMLSLDEDGR